MSVPRGVFRFRFLYRLAWRHARRRLLQSFFLIAGVAIGVAMMVAIDLANGSAQRAFELAAETITGRATHQIVGGPGGVDEGVYVDLRREAGHRMSAPVVEGYVSIGEMAGQPMRLLGVDPFADAPFRSYLGTGSTGETAPDFLPSLMASPGTVLVSDDVAARYGLKPGDRLTARRGSSLQTLEIAGLLAPSDDLSRRALETLLIADIATAQEVLDRTGRLDRIDLIIDESSAGQLELERLAGFLPASVYITTSAARNGVVSDMTEAFRLNLTALSLLALVVGMFLIYNTVTFSVVQRRPVLGSLRALGMTRREVFAVVLLEALVLGVLGTLLGLALGILLGRGAVQLVTQTINDLFFVVTVRDVDVPATTLLKGAVIGVVASLVAAAAPAFEATSVPPAGAFRRSNVEERASALLPRLSGVGIGLLVLGAALLVPEGSIVIAFAGLFAVIVGSALLTPLLTLGLMGVAQWLANRYAGIVGRMAPRTIVRSLSRTSVAVAALMVSVSVIIGVGIMTGSFRTTVRLWLQDVLQADIYVSPPSLAANQVLTALDQETVLQLEGYPGISRLATSRGVDVSVFWSEADGNPTTEDVEKIRLIALSEDLAGPDRQFRSSIGTWDETWRGVEDGGLIVNEPMANRHNLRVGDRLRLLTDRGPRSFPIVGIAVDYDVRAVAFIHDPVFRSYWNDHEVSAVALFVDAGVDVDQKVAELRSALSGEEELLVRSNRATRQEALTVFDRTFMITVALQLLAMIVAFIGILSTLMSLQLERIREIGILRSTGMTRRQLWRLSLLETGLIGSSAGLVAIPTGVVLAAVLIYIINLRSFGWTLQMQIAPIELGRAFLVAVVAALVAGIFPAWRMARSQPAAALRSE